MAMDEIQDLTLRRSQLRLERQELIDRQFAGFQSGHAGHVRLSEPLIHIRAVALPLLEHQIDIRDEVLTALSGPPRAYKGITGEETVNDVIFRDLSRNWVPILRGRARQSLIERSDLTHGETFLFARKTLKQNGLVSWEHAIRYFHAGSVAAHFPWWVGFLSAICADIERLAAIMPTLLPITLRVGFRSAGDIMLIAGESVFRDAHPVPEQISYLPDFTISSVDDLPIFFEQAQEDLFSLAEVYGGVYSLSERDPSSLT